MTATHFSTGSRRRNFGVLGGVVLGLLALAASAAFLTGIPGNAAGMAAKGVCSAAFVAGRPLGNLMAQDVLPASPVLHAIGISIDEKRYSVTASFAGLVSRRASFLGVRGCVLDAEPVPGARPSFHKMNSTLPWPAGDAPVPVNQWDPDVNAAELNRIADHAFVGAGDPAAANARGLAVVFRGRLLLLRESAGFDDGTRLHGWSMTKTVAGMLFFKIADETGLDLNTPVVDAFLPGRAPAWVADWRRDARRAIKVSDLLFMRDGLGNTESYEPWGDVPKMLWGEQDMAAWAAAHPADAPPGQRWRYLSATANILAAVSRGRFQTDDDYLAYPTRELFDPIGARSAVIETDAAGTWVASSYMWASTSDWARVGLLMLRDGMWNDTRVLPAGWLNLASTPSTADGAGTGYGAQTWLFGKRKARLDCLDFPGIPEDTVAMGGHWGQVVAMVPSRDLVVVRMGWTFDGDQFDDCELLHDILSAIPN